MTSELFGDRGFAKRHAADWLGAVDLAGSIWLQEGDCDESYIELIKQQLTENNAYAVILPGLVLLHAEPGHGVNRNTLMIITLDGPVCFGHEFNDPVQVMICFTSLQTQDHLQSMKKIAKMLLDDDFADRAAAAPDDAALMELICSLESAYHGG